MCFKRIEPIGSKDDHVSSGPEHPQGLIQGLLIVSDVLDDLIQEDYIDRVVVEGQLLRRSGDERQPAIAAGAYPLLVDVYPVHAGAELG